MYKRKKLLSIFLIFTLIFSHIMHKSIKVEGKTTQEYANLVYFVDFNDSQGNYLENRKNNILDMFQGNKDTSLTNYINKISYGQLQIFNYFPQLNSGEITPYRMSKDRSYYNSDWKKNELIMEVLKNVPVNSEYNIDRNNDGVIDNIIIVVSGEVNDRNDIFWPHKSNIYGGNVNGKSSGTYNLHNEKSLFSIMEGEGVLAHEYLHSIGYPDLYRSSNDGKPVGPWDLMSSTSPFLQYPLAYLRSSISNWGNMNTITEDGRYTLNPVSVEGGNQAFILKTGISDKEFFVVEYRKKGNPYKSELDSKIPGDGLIIYRVDTTKDSNILGDDYIYVFRPGETLGKTGYGDLNSSFLSLESGRTSFGNSDLSSNIGDNSITYASGQNSGIVIDNVSSAGETISFDVNFGDVSSLGIWETLGKEEVAKYTSNTISFDIANNSIYGFYKDDITNKIKGKRYNGSIWEELNTNILGYEPVVKVYNGIPYLMYFDNNYNCIVKKYVNGTWSNVVNLGQSQYTDIIANDQGIFIAYTDGESANVKVVRVSESGVENIGGVITSNRVNSLSLAKSNGEIYIAYIDFPNGNFRDKNLNIKKLNNYSWDMIYSKSSNCDVVKLIGDKNKLYLTVLENWGLDIFEVKGETLVSLPKAINSNTIEKFDVSIDNEVLYLAYYDGNKKEIEVKYFRNEQWLDLGYKVHSGEAVTKLQLNVSNNKVYVGYNVQENNYEFYIKTKDILLEEDINKDNIVDLLDLSLVASKYNVKVTSVNYDIKCDINNDGIIDIFDIVLVARKIQ